MKSYMDTLVIFKNLALVGTSVFVLIHYITLANLMYGILFVLQKTWDIHNLIPDYMKLQKHVKY